MNKTQLQGIAVALLLGALVLVWTLRPRGAPPQPAQTAVPPVSSSASEDLPSPPPSAAGSPVQAPAPVELARDYFQLPPSLQKRFEEKRRAEEEERLRKEQAQRIPTGPASVPEVSGAEVAQRFQLQGIFWGTARPQAVINRQILSVGDRMQDAEVASITKDRVTLSIHDQEFVLTPKRPESGGSRGDPMGRRTIY